MSLEQNIVTEKRSELLAVASAMLDGRMNLIEGARRVCALRHATGDPDNKVFMPIRAIESETDHFPIGETRLRCAGDYLQRTDDEMRRYLADAGEEILYACREIIRAFSPVRNDITGNIITIIDKESK